MVVLIVMHLAQLNVAHMRAPMDSPELADFVAALEPINTLADAPRLRLAAQGGRRAPTDLSSTTTATTC